MATRGGFLSSLSLAAVAPAVPALPDHLAKPAVLRRGDRVGLIAPASPPTGDDVELSRAHVEGFGLVPVLGDHVRDVDGFLAGSDQARADDFNRMARDPSIRAIVAIRGGYGTMRILDALDYAALAADPKIVMGYSDLTAVLNAVTMRSRIVTFHGPVGAHGSSWGGTERVAIERALFSSKPLGRLPIPAARRIRAGRATGRLAGGNLSLVSSLAGTPYAVAAAGAILFLEEVEEAPYRVDRMLTQLLLAGDLTGARGLLFGQCTRCDDGSLPTAASVIDERLGAADRPALAGAPFGHMSEQWVLPIGLRATLDVEAAELVLAEPACRE